MSDIKISAENINDLQLDDGSSVAVIGGGPAGSFFSYFFLELADRTGIEIQLDIYEPKDFSRAGSSGCNHCGGIVSESLVQILATEGINIPSQVIQTGIKSYVMHFDNSDVKIETPLDEKRIAAMFRGGGPRGDTDKEKQSFDGFLQNLVKSKGANLIHEKVTKIDYSNILPEISTNKRKNVKYDLIVGAVGLTKSSLRLFENASFGFTPPKTVNTYINEFLLGEEIVKEYFGNSMHVFLLDIPDLKFGALIPKGNYVSLVLLGNNINQDLVNSFLWSDAVKNCFPTDVDLKTILPCKCYPSINISGAKTPFTNRIVLIGDCAVSKLYKNGIGAAYITAKAAATTSIFEGVSKTNFQKNYYPVCKSLALDNKIGKLVFSSTTIIQKLDILKRGIMRLVKKEQNYSFNKNRMSTVLWDTFTGSATYKEIFFRAIMPLNLLRMLSNIISALSTRKN